MSSPPQAEPSLVGRVFSGQFRLEALLGRGGMGEVYLAEQLELGRRVVLKLLLNSEAWSEPELEERFRREARILARLNHPNIVQLYSFGRTDDGISYLAMEYVEGRTLTTTIAERGALPEPLVLGILDQIGSALVEASRHSIVHRDLKPDNVMTVDRYGEAAFVKVLDFGIAKLTRAHDPRITRSGAILGTPQYMAPEQLREQPLDERTDIHALGLIGYELLTGEVPFRGESTMDLMMRVLNEEAEPPSRKPRGEHVSAATEALICKCLAKDPSQRFQTPAELREALAAIPREPTGPLSGEHEPRGPRSEPLRVSLYSPEFDEPTERPQRGRRSLGLTAAACGTVLVALAGLAWFVSSADPLRMQAALQPKAADSAAPLTLREWVQGMPFPQGTDYLSFERQFVEARIPAEAGRVLAFYRQLIHEKWGTFQDQGSELVVPNPNAPIASVMVWSEESGSRLFIQRRDPP